MGHTIPDWLRKKMESTPGVTIGFNRMAFDEETIARVKKKELIDPKVMLHPDGILQINLPVDCSAAEVNQRDWKGRSRRNSKAWRTVSAVLGRELAVLSVFADHYHAGLPLEIHFTRLGGRTVDRTNLPTCLKAVEDAFAYMLGADDGEKGWVSYYHQSPNPKYGCRIHVTRLGAPGGAPAK